MPRLLTLFATLTLHSKLSAPWSLQNCRHCINGTCQHCPCCQMTPFAPFAGGSCSRIHNRTRRATRSHAEHLQQLQHPHPDCLWPCSHDQGPCHYACPHLLHGQDHFCCSWWPCTGEQSFWFLLQICISLLCDLWSGSFLAMYVTIPPCLLHDQRFCL